ncbi:MAG: SIS domain-containing protein [Bdellovibrionota bacterium]
MQEDPRTKNEIPQADNIADYLSGYSQKLHDAAARLPRANLENAFELLVKTMKLGGQIYVGGNGGSAAIADHLCCDWLKGTYIETKPALRVHSMSSNSALFTALANDFGYEHTLSRQLEMLGEPGDLAVLISSSGNSPNVVKAAEAALAKGMPVLGLTGFSGGKLRELATVSLHVQANNYGIVEDTHQMLMHVLAQYLNKTREP